MLTFLCMEQGTYITSDNYRYLMVTVVNVMVMAVLFVYGCHQTTRKVHAPGVAVTGGVMGGSIAVAVYGNRIYTKS